MKKPTHEIWVSELGSQDSWSAELWAAGPNQRGQRSSSGNLFANKVSVAFDHSYDSDAEKVFAAIVFLTQHYMEILGEEKPENVMQAVCENIEANQGASAEALDAAASEAADRMLAANFDVQPVDEDRLLVRRDNLKLWTSFYNTMYSYYEETGELP